MRSKYNPALTVASEVTQPRPSMRLPANARSNQPTKASPRMAKHSPAMAGASLANGWNANHYSQIPPSPVASALLTSDWNATASGRGIACQPSERHSPAFTGSRRAGSSICPVSTGKSGANGTLPAVGPRTSHGSSLRPPRKMVAPVPCRRALRLLRPAWHGFALRVPARLCLRLFQALPAAAQSTATGAPRPLLYPGE